MVRNRLLDLKIKGFGKYYLVRTLTPARLYLLSCVLLFTGCSLPYEPHPTSVVRIPIILNSSLSYFTGEGPIYIDGYFESAILQHLDSDEINYTNQVVFFNHLGNQFIPDQPFSILLNGLLVDRTADSLMLVNSDSINYSLELTWNINGNKIIPSFETGIIPPHCTQIKYPLPHTANILQRESFEIDYDACGPDSVYIHLDFFGNDSSKSSFMSFHHLTYHVINQSPFILPKAIIDQIPPKENIEIFVTSLSSIYYQILDRTYNLRAGIVDHSSATFSD